MPLHCGAAAAGSPCEASALLGLGCAFSVLLFRRHPAGLFGVLLFYYSGVFLQQEIIFAAGNIFCSRKSL
jgi:hypothetical protein